MRTNATIFIFVMLIAASVLASSASRGPDNSTRDKSGLSAECQTFINTTLPSHGWKSGFVSVPEDWGVENSPQIQVFYYYNDVGSAASKPVLFLNGGPFTSYHNRMDALASQLGAYDTSSEKHTFVMMDQRGTGCSVPNLPEQRKIEMARFGSYGSTQIVRDAEAIRAKLFSTQSWSLFAQSYGGFLAMRYLEYFPQSLNSIHVYGPVFHESMTDFFWMRIKKQNEVLQKFLAAYPNDGLETALTKIAGVSGQNYCLPASAGSGPVCGQALADVLVATIGQGRGRKLGSTEVWDMVRSALLSLKASDPSDPKEANHAAFIQQSAGAAAFFTEPTIAIVAALWGQDMKFLDGNQDRDCEAAYGVLRGQGVDPASLPLDECRIIRKLIPSGLKQAIAKDFAKAKGTDLLTHEKILRMIEANPSVPVSVYTGELDSLAQTASLEWLTSSNLVTSFNFSQSGHAGWLYEPVVWKRLMEIQ